MKSLRRRSPKVASRSFQASTNQAAGFVPAAFFHAAINQVNTTAFAAVKPCCHCNAAFEHHDARNAASALLSIFRMSDITGDYLFAAHDCRLARLFSRRVRSEHRCALEREQEAAVGFSNNL